ncbi:MAG: PH domain-containing protein [Patescibacteria group bacterium]
MINKNAIPNRQTGEEIVLHLRRHWFIFFKIFLFFVFLALIPWLIYLFLKFAAPSLLTNELGYPFLLVLTLSYYLIMIVFALTTWTENYLDVWTVTTCRIINREQNGLFNRVVSELDLAKIQDVTAEQKGFFATILHYGDVYIQSAATRERFSFEQIPQPYKIAKIIQKLNEKIPKEQNPA